MNVAWCMMALALAGTDDGSQGESCRPSSPIAIQIEIGLPADQSDACCEPSPGQKAQASETKPAAGATASSAQPKLQVGRIDFTGNHFASGATLKTHIATRKPIVGLFGRDNTDMLDEDKHKLMDYYQSQGFFEVQVTPVTQSAEAPGKVDVTFVIFEGTRYKVRNVVIEGNSKIKTEALRKDLELHSGKPFILAVREADKNRMLIKYGEIGCIDAEVGCEPKFTDQPGIVDLVYKIEEHEPYVSGELRIEGDARTKRKVHRREAAMMRLSSGQAADKIRAHLFRQRLMALGYFQTEPNGTKKTETENAIRDLADDAEKLCEAVAQATVAAIQTKPAADPVSQAVAAFIEHDPSSCVALATTSTPSTPADKPCSTVPAPAAASEAAELWPMTLQQAVQIGLDNSEIVRVIAFGAQGIPIGGFEPTPLNTGAGAGVASSLGSGLSQQTATGAAIGVVNNMAWSYQNSSFLVRPSAYTTNIQLTLTQPLLSSGPQRGQAAGRPVGLEANRAPIVIARLNSDAAVWRFKSEVMAHVRSVEQVYWNLAQAHVALWAAEQAVKIAEEVCRREGSKLTLCASAADAAEAAQRLERFKCDLATRASDVTTSERQLRTILGLPPADNRRIIPVTPPTTARIEPDWNACLGEMTRNQPDILHQKLLLNLAERELLMATEKGPAETTLRRSRSYLDQVVNQTTRSLARFFLGIDANYKQFKTASRLRSVAAQNLEAQRAYYDEGRITADRFLDGVSQYATAVATEAQYNTTYNIYLAALPEAKGTLLDERNIIIAEPPASRAAWHAATARKDDLAKPASLDAAKNEPVKPLAEDSTKDKPATWTFSISIGKDKPLQIEAKITVHDSALPSAATP
jgi:hypothetical protein